MGKLVSVPSSVIDGALDTGGIVRLGDPLGRLTDGVEKGVVNAGKLKETEFPDNETSEIEPTVREDNVGKLPLGNNVVLSDTSGTDCEASEVPVNPILERLVVNALARSLVGITPGVIELGVVKPGAVNLTETEGTERVPVKISEEGEGRPSDRLVGSPSEATEMLPADKVGSTDPILDVTSDESPDRLGRSDVGAATEVGSGMRLDALKVPGVYTVTVYGSGTKVTVTWPSQTG